jgi:osmotically-inducible protein OsmY
VQLSGVVESSADPTHAEEVTRRVRGIKAVVNNL